MSTSTRRVVITGVSRGLGRAMAEQFIGRGHTVFACARSELALKELRQQFDGPHQFDEVDVADDAQVQAWATRVIDRHVHFEKTDGDTPEERARLEQLLKELRIRTLETELAEAARRRREYVVERQLEITIDR